MKITLELPRNATVQQVQALLLAGIRQIERKTGPENAANTRHMRRLMADLVGQLAAYATAQTGETQNADPE